MTTRLSPGTAGSVMPPRAPGLRCAAFAAGIVLLALGGCGSSRLAREPAAPTDLTGRWILDRNASDDAARAVAAALPKPKRRDATPPGDEERTETFRPRGRASPQEFLREYVVPAEYLEIVQGPNASLTIVQGSRRRTHELGSDFPPSVTDRFGTRVVRAGWEGRELVVRSESGTQVRLRETFRAGPQPDTLAYRVELDARGLKDVEIDALYRRASDLPGPLPETEAAGPPAPQR